MFATQKNTPSPPSSVARGLSCCESPALHTVPTYAGPTALPQSGRKITDSRPTRHRGDFRAIQPRFCPLAIHRLFTAGGCTGFHATVQQVDLPWLPHLQRKPGQCSLCRAARRSSTAPASCATLCATTNLVTLRGQGPCREGLGGALWVSKLTILSSCSLQGRLNT